VYLSEIPTGDLPLNLSEFLESSRRLLQATTKPSREELWTLFKISMLGLIVLGTIGFMVRVVFWFINLAP
jgi:protein translocase SEC61 complex gamma subunit